MSIYKAILPNFTVSGKTFVRAVTLSPLLQDMTTEGPSSAE